MKRVRPELDLYLLSNGRFEETAGNPNANALRRVFYAVDELLELHLAILEGEQARYDTPFFNNLKKYAQRPIGTLHHILGLSQPNCGRCATRTIGAVRVFAILRLCCGFGSGFFESEGCSCANASSTCVVVETSATVAGTVTQASVFAICAGMTVGRLVL